MDEQKMTETITIAMERFTKPFAVPAPTETITIPLTVYDRLLVKETALDIVMGAYSHMNDHEARQVFRAIGNTLHLPRERGKPDAE